MNPVQTDLFQARAERDAALAQVQENAAEEWRTAARAAVRSLALVHDEFVIDLVWACLEADGQTTHEPRALGAIMQAAVRAGWVEKTGRYVQSERKVCHARDIPVYRSLLRAQRCPRCDSPSPRKHPAMQFEGEVQPCPHPWHKQAA